MRWSRSEQPPGPTSSDASRAGNALKLPSLDDRRQIRWLRGGG